MWDMNHFRVLLLCIVGVAGPSSAGGVTIASLVPAGTDRAEYALTFSANTPQRFHVRADLPVENNELS